jgi:predicted metal-dependent hydrolase
MDARLREGIRLFNAGRYFECHEVLESFYLQAEERHKPFLEALVGLAVACRLQSEFGETKGAVRMIRQALVRLDAYRPTHLGVRVKLLIETMERWTELLESPAFSEEGHVPRIPFRRFTLF